jgi:hypothetical protein
MAGETVASPRLTPPGIPLVPKSRNAGVDPITVLVAQHRLHAIAEEMGEAMLRTLLAHALQLIRDRPLASQRGREQMTCLTVQDGGLSPVRNDGVEMF